MISPDSTKSFRGGGARVLIALALVALAAAAIAAPAGAAPATGSVILTLKKGAKSSLLRQGVKVSAHGADASNKARRGGRVQVLSLPVLGASFGGKTSIRAGGTIAFRGDGKSTRLRGAILRVGPRSAALSAKLGGKRVVFFRAGGTSLDGASARVKGPLALTGKGARALRSALGIKAIGGGRIGSAWALASLSPAQPLPRPEAPMAPVIPTPEPTPDPDPEPEAEAYPYEEQCPVPAVEGTEGFAETPAAVDGIAPAPDFGAGTTQPLTGTEIDWGFKDSFRSYVAFVPPAGSLQALDGAVEHPNGSMAVAGSYWEFPNAGGSYEAGSAPDHSDDKLVADGTGTVLLCKPGHGFDYALKNPTVTIDGDHSRLSADVGVNLNGVWYPYQRVDVADLDLTGIEPEVADGGNSVTWEDVPVTMSADGEIATGGLYPAGEALDPITVKTELDRPLLAECGIEAGLAETPPAVDFALAPLPTLTAPVSGEGGTINWGFRRGTRNVVVLGGGAFSMLSGASESYPGNMGGGNSAAPSGGLGKFFRFPVSEYQYEAGTADPGDDRLIATSDASVGFCNPDAGNYGVVLSKPTLVIDGSESRLIANSYSFMAGMGWIGGRVELVDLDTAAIDAVATAGTVSWGEVNGDETPLDVGIPVAGAIKTEALSLAGLTPAATASGWDPVATQIELPAP